MTPAVPGVYERTLLVDVDGTRNSESGVTWIQGPTLYVDLRVVAGEPIEGFAGQLTCSDGIFEWHRDIDLGPERAGADAGTLGWDGDVLIERGAHEPYVEHWTHTAADDPDVWAATLSAADGARAIVVRAGSRFGFAAAGSSPVVAMGSAATWRFDTASSPALIGTDLNLGRWTVSRTEGKYPS